MSAQHPSARSQRRWPRRAVFTLALLFIWASGVNMATHHWWNAVGDLLLAATLLVLASARFEAT